MYHFGVHKARSISILKNLRFPTVHLLRPCSLASCGGGLHSGFHCLYPLHPIFISLLLLLIRKVVEAWLGYRYPHNHSLKIAMYWSSFISPWSCSAISWWSMFMTVSFYLTWWRGFASLTKLPQRLKIAITLNLIFSVTVFNLSCSIQIVNLIIVSQTLNVSPTIFVISWGIIDVRCCNYYHLRSDISSKFQSSMIISHHGFWEDMLGLWPMDELFHHPRQHL